MPVCNPAAQERGITAEEQIGHSSIQVTVDLYCHWIPGSSRQAVNRLDEAVDILKTGGRIRN
ncbi:MAG TPA: hypothetical protein VL329_09665 [Nitrospiraceae bacterium]|nr:hypothetical protein [Nitrospiraceae bacterium]